MRFEPGKTPDTPGHTAHQCPDRGASYRMRHGIREEVFNNVRLFTATASARDHDAGDGYALPAKKEGYLWTAPRFACSTVRA